MLIPICKLFKNVSHSSLSITSLPAQRAGHHCLSSTIGREKLKRITRRSYSCMSSPPSSSGILQAVEMVSQLFIQFQHQREDLHCRSWGESKKNEEAAHYMDEKMSSSSYNAVNLIEEENFSDDDEEDGNSSFKEKNKTYPLLLMMKQVLMCCQLVKEADEREGNTFSLYKE